MDGAELRRRSASLGLSARSWRRLRSRFRRPDAARRRFAGLCSPRGDCSRVLKGCAGCSRACLRSAGAGAHVRQPSNHRPSCLRGSGSCSRRPVWQAFARASRTAGVAADAQRRVRRLFGWCSSAATRRATRCWRRAAYGRLPGPRSITRDRHTASFALGDRPDARRNPVSLARLRRTADDRLVRGAAVLAWFAQRIKENRASSSPPRLARARLRAQASRSMCRRRSSSSRNSRPGAPVS